MDVVVLIYSLGVDCGFKAIRVFNCWTTLKITLVKEFEGYSLKIWYRVYDTRCFFFNPFLKAIWVTNDNELA